MASYEVTLKAGTTEQIENADAYQQEGPMTTFFRITSGRQVVDSWSIRLASFRTTDVVAVRRQESEMTAMASMPSLRSA
jgi:hypothetical protein